MSTDLLSLWGAIQRGDMHAIASHIFPPSTDTARKPYMTSQGQEDATNAGLGSVEAGASPIRFWTVRFERGGRSYYDRVEAPDACMASRVTLLRNVGAVCSQTVGEITRAEYDRFTRRSP